MHRISKYISLLLITALALSCSTHYRLADTSSKQYRLQAGDKVTPDEDLDQFFTPYRIALKGKTKEVLLQSAIEMTKRKPESTLGNFFTDVFYEEAAKLTDKPLAFAAQNYGGLRRPSLPKGDITVGHIYELMPFENYIVILKGDSSLLQRFFDRIAAHGGWPVSKQVHFRIDGEKAVDLLLNGKPLQGGETYYFALPDYIANGGDRFFFLKEVPREETGVLIRDAVINNLRKKGGNGVTLHPALENRIIIEQP